MFKQYSSYEVNKLYQLNLFSVLPKIEVNYTKFNLKIKQIGKLQKNNCLLMLKYYGYKIKS